MSLRTQSPERGRKREQHPLPVLRSQSPSLRTQSPERGRKPSPLTIGIATTSPLRSSDPKPREGTKTPGREGRTRVHLRLRTQSPERGRKHETNTELCQFRIVSLRTQSPERGRKPQTEAPARHGGRRSGLRTQSPERGRKPRIRLRGDAVRYSRLRTQSPERGRKLATVSPRRTSATGMLVFGPKAPRGDENPVIRAFTDFLQHWVFGPKAPRGDENSQQDTPRRTSSTSSLRTQSPERGRKRTRRRHASARACGVSSDPKPREGTKTSTTRTAPKTL